MRGSRFPSALVAALCAHAALLVVLAAHRPVARESAATATTDDVFEVSEEPPPPLAPPTAEPVGATAVATVDAVVAKARTRARSPAAKEPTALDVVPEPPGPPSPRADAAPVALGVGDYWKQVAMAGGRAGIERAEATLSIEDSVRGPSDARDRAMGLGAAGAFVSVAHDAASPSLAPDVGTATLEIECDATGTAVSARVVSADGDLGAWNDVARELVRLATSKRAKLPHGARGLRAQLRIVAERALPSGEKRTIGAGAAPDDVCEGTGLNRRCTAGMPVGVGGTWGDLANIGAKRSRVVHVRVIDEAAL